jgi:hypothetical protein
VTVHQVTGLKALGEPDQERRLGLLRRFATGTEV